MGAIIMATPLLPHFFALNDDINTTISRLDDSFV